MLGWKFHGYVLALLALNQEQGKMAE